MLYWMALNLAPPSNQPEPDYRWGREYQPIPELMELVAARVIFRFVAQVKVRRSFPNFPVKMGVSPKMRKPWKMTLWMLADFP